MQQYISSPKKTSRILSEYGIRLRKSLGQNYMIDTNSIKKMVSLAGIKNGEIILEIGSGIGSLTEILLQSGAGRVLCIEIDKKISEIFGELFSKELKTGKVELIISDAMDLDYNELSSEYGIKKMISNLPYKIAAPLILKILKQEDNIRSSWITIQKDIADRLTAKLGDKIYSSYTVKANTLAEFEACFKISRNCFIPRPNVDSVVVKMTRKKIPTEIGGIGSVQGFFDFISSSFLHRRKRLLNSLALNKKYSNRLEEIERLLLQSGYSRNVRAENLAVKDYLFIYSKL